MLDYFHVRNTFFLNGEDTLLYGIRHKKLFFSYNGDTANAFYYGGIFEDSLRRVWYNGKKPPHIEDFFQTSDEYSCLLFDFSLDVGDTIDYRMSNTDAEVVSFDLLLRPLDGVRQHLMLDLLALRHAQRIKHIDQLFRTEETHEVVLK